MTESHGAGELARRVRWGGCGNVQPARAATRRVLTQSLVTACAVDLAGHQVGRPFFLDTGGFDGRQARTRRQIDLLKSKVERLEAVRSTLPDRDVHEPPLPRQLTVLSREIARCWRKYHARNRDLAHLAA